MKKHIIADVDSSAGLTMSIYDNERDFTRHYLSVRIGIEPSERVKYDLEKCEFPEQEEALRLFHEGRYQEAIDAASELDPTDYDYPEIATEEIEIDQGRANRPGEPQSARFTPAQLACLERVVDAAEGFLKATREDIAETNRILQDLRAPELERAVPSPSPLDNPERFAEWLAAHHIIDEAAIHDAEHFDGGITMRGITNALNSLKS